MAEKKIENKIQARIQENENLNEKEQILVAGELFNEIDNVDVDAALTTVKKRITSKSRIHKLYINFSRIAAILVLPLIVYSLWTLTDEEPAQYVGEITDQSISCPLGMRSQIVLPDGSKVWLNAGSTIEYQIPFVRENRSVRLVGEAYFDVIKNEASPFTVQSKKIKVDVLGTQFNFKSYNDDKTIEVALREGNVKLGILSGETAISETEMIPNDHFTFNKNTSKAVVKNKDISSLIAWKDNYLVFDDTPILEMEKILERWYGVQIDILDKSIKSYRYTTTFENMPIEQVLELLELSSPIKTVYIPSRLDKQTNQLIPPRVKISKKDKK